MKTYTVIFKVPDDYKPIREFISCWFKDSSGKDVSVTNRLMDIKEVTSYKICEVKKNEKDTDII